jgi:hypothetical protein
MNTTQRLNRLELESRGEHRKPISGPAVKVLLSTHALTHALNVDFMMEILTQVS